MLQRTPLLTVVAAVGLFTGGHWAVAAGSGGPRTAEVHVVRLSDPDREFAFEPAELVITAGTTVRWVNDDDVFHTVTTSDSPIHLTPNNLIRGRLSRAGDVVEFTFDQPGDYIYYCQPHAEFMMAVIRVMPAEPK